MKTFGALLLVVAIAAGAGWIGGVLADPVALATRIQRLERVVAAHHASTGDRGLEMRVDDLDERIEVLDGRFGVEARVDALESKVRRIDTDVSSAQQLSSSGRTGVAERVEAVEEKVAVLERSVAAIVRALRTAQAEGDW